MARKLGKSKAGGAGATGLRETKRLEKAIARAAAKVAKRRAQLEEASVVLADLQKRLPPAVASSPSTAPSAPTSVSTPPSSDDDAGTLG